MKRNWLAEDVQALKGHIRKGSAVEYAAHVNTPVGGRTTRLDGVEAARDGVGTVTWQAAAVAGATAGQVQATVESWLSSKGRVSGAVGVTLGAAAVGAVVWLVSRRRR